MLKSLKKKSKRLIILKIRLKDFICKELWQHVIVLASIVLCSYLFDRWVEGISFCVAHTCIRPAFDKQFHLINATAYCIIVTSAIIWYCIPNTLPLAVSLLSSIPIAFAICYIGYLIQDNIDKATRIKALEKYATELVMQLARYTEKDIYAMDDRELYEHCRSRGLSEEDCRIAYFVVRERLQGKELYEAIGYSERQTKRKRKQILDTIK